MKKLNELLNKKQSKEVTFNWYCALGASTIVAGFYAPNEEARIILFLMGVIIFTFACLIRYGKGK